MAKIKVHVLNFHNIFSHIELVLENTSTNPHTYYGINRWAPPKTVWQPAPDEPSSYIGEASSRHSFTIEADPIELMNDWRAYYRRTDRQADMLGENCAVAAQKFLTDKANIPQPSQLNPSVNHLFMGLIWWPSFIPCPVTLPGRIMSNVKFYTKQFVGAFDDLPVAHENSYIGFSACRLRHMYEAADAKTQANVTARFNSLIIFYERLNRMNAKAYQLEHSGYAEDANAVRQCVDELSQAADDYLVSNADDAYKTFKATVNQKIEVIAPVVSQHPDLKQIVSNVALAVVGVGVLYLLAVVMHKRATGHYLFFQTSAKDAADQLKNSLNFTEAWDQAREQHPLKSEPAS